MRVLVGYHHHGSSWRRKAAAATCSALAREFGPVRINRHISNSAQLSTREQVQKDARSMHLQKLLREYGAKHTTPLSINQMFDFGQYDSPGRNRSTTLLAAAQFVHEELPVRVAHLIQDLLALPFGLSQNSAIQEVVELFHTTINEVTEHPRPKSSKEERELRERIKKMLRRHRNIVTHMRSALASDLLSEDEKLSLQPFLDRFYATRIGNRTMLAHYVELGQAKKDNWVGLINDKCHISKVVSSAYSIATAVCTQHHQIQPPSLVVVGATDTTIRYVESHLEYMLTEVLHNSIYSTWQHHTAKTEMKSVSPLPEIKVVIAEGEKDITVAILDQGGGFGRKNFDSIWTHLHFPDSCFITHHHGNGSENNILSSSSRSSSTDDSSSSSSSSCSTEGDSMRDNCYINKNHDSDSINSKDTLGVNAHDLSPLINGYSRAAPRLSQNGLPVCRLYARHFGGELSIQAMENYGCDVFITLRKDGDFPEAIPALDYSVPGSSLDMPQPKHLLI
mmetsp:Transcript_32651/g.55399  ORF Transcript_32651/g.55399 Transcript_32651/m.55399 type:complete len:507 (+) Transcript_32651:3-1523(+)